MRRCGSCNRPLRSPKSIELGYGPGCWSRLQSAKRDDVPAGLGGADPASPGATPAHPVTAGPAVSHRAAPLAVPAPSRPPQRSDSPLAALASWAVGLLLVLAVALFWRWLLMAGGVVLAMALAGLLLEHLDERAMAGTRARRHGAGAVGRLVGRHPLRTKVPSRTSTPRSATTSPRRV